MPDTTKHTIGRWINEELDRALEQNTPSPETRQAIIEQTTPPAMQQIPGVDYKQTGRWINEELDRHLAQIAPEEPAKQKSDQEQRGFFAEAGSAVGQGFVTTGESIVSLGEMLRVPGMKSTAEYLRKLRDHEMLRRPDYLAEGDILEKPERLADWRWWVRSLGENIPNLLAVYAGVGGAAKAAQVLNWGQKAIRTTAFAAGFGGSFSIEAGAQYSQAKQEMQRTGLLEDDAIERIATAEGLIAGTVNAILEVIPADNLIFRNKDAKKLLSKIVRQGLWEGGTEMVQEGVNVLVSQHGHAPDQKLSAELGRIIEAGLTGLVLGGGAAAVHAPFESAGASPAPSEQGAAPSAKPHTDMPIVPSNEASKTHVTEGQRQTTLDEKHAADVQKHAANLYDTITAEVAAENEELEAARAAEIARREAETAAQAAQEQAEIDAAVTDAREQQATLKTTLAADNPQKQTIVDDVLSLTEKRLITALQKEMGLTITPAGPNLYSLETPAGPAPANLFDLRQRLAQHRITALDAKIAKQQADEKALAEAEERRAARKAEKDAESTLRHVRHLLNINSMLSASHISTLEQNYEQLTDTEKSKLNQAKHKEYTEMSLDEYIFRTTDGTPAAIPEAKRRHRELIIQARAAGKPVSPAALKDHPDLQETAQDKDILDEQENPDYQPAPVPASDNINTAALVTQMLTDLENSGQAGLVYDPATNSNKRISAGVAWLTAANKAGVKVDRAEARAILKKVQNKDTLTPRQETIFNAISSAARKHGGDYLEEATAWAEKGFTPLAGRKINIDDLTFGDRLVIAGEEFRVTDIDDAGNVTMKDGTIRKVRQGSTINDVDYFRPNPEAASFDMESLQSGPKSTAEEEAPKEPWKMTRDEYVKVSVEQHTPEYFKKTGNYKKDPIFYVTVRRNIAGGRYKYEAYDTEGNKIAESSYITAAGSIPFKLNRRKGKYTALDSAFYEIADNEKFSFDWYKKTISDFTADAHKIIVEKALSEGKPVPPEVLKDYPELTKKEKKIPQSVTTTTGLKPKTEKPAPAKTEKQRKLIGQNTGGHDLYEDENGMRSFTVNGVRRTEPVQIIPTRAGAETFRDESRRPDEFKTTEEVKPAEKEKPAFGSENKIFTEDKAARAREILKNKFKKYDPTQLNTGIDPEILTAGIDLAGYYIEGGARSFMDFSQKMIADIGEAIRPYLKSLYMAVRNYPGTNKTGMNTEAEIDAINENEIGKEPAEEATEVEKQVFNKYIPFKELDASISISAITDEDSADYKHGYRFEASISYPDSLGERGLYRTGYVYKTYPTKQEMKDDILHALKTELEDKDISDPVKEAIEKVLPGGKNEAAKPPPIPQSVQATTGLKTPSLFGAEAKTETPEQTAIGLIAGSKVEYVKERGYEFIAGTPTAEEKNILTGLITGAAADKLAAANITIRKKAETPAPAPPADETASAFKIADRVVMPTRDNRHGEIIEDQTYSVTTQTIFGGQKETKRYPNFKVRSDNGVVYEMVEPQNLQKETARPDKVIPDILMPEGIKGYPSQYYEPDDILVYIANHKKRKQNLLAAAQRARKKTNIDAYKNNAAEHGDIAARLQEIYDKWAQENPGAAPAKPAPTQSVQATTGLKPATLAETPAAGTADLGAYGLKVSQGKTNTGKTVWNVTGPETRTWKETIKRIGGRWYGPKKVWSFFNGDPSEALLAALPPLDEVHSSIRDKYAAQTTAAPEAPAQEQEAAAFANVSDSIFYNLKERRKFSREDLFKICDTAFGGTLAEGKYSAKDAYDAMEMGINKYLLYSGTLKYALDAAGAQQAIAKIKKRLELIPTQTTRTAEMEEFQQFSTPPSLAYVANWVADLQYKDVYLEPSAGTGNLAIFARLAGIPIDNIIVNELAPRRAMILKELGFTQVFTENAEQINNILPWEIKPTVVVMNPPFSATAGRMAGQRKTINATAHIEQALKRLQPGGRLVGIVGNGMADDKPAFRDWWAKIDNDYSVRANIGISGKEYAKYGTSFDNQIIVIDKPLAKSEKKSILKVTGNVDTVEELITLLEGVRNDRITIPAQQAGTQSEMPPGTRTGESVNRPGHPSLFATDDLGITPNRGRGRTLDRNDLPNDRLETPQRDEISNQDRQAGTRAGGLGTSQNAARPGDTTDFNSPRPSDADAAGLSVSTAPSDIQSLTIGQQTAVAKTAELTDAIFDEYKPAKLTVAGAQPHPGKLVESVAMATVEPIDPTYAPHLPERVIKNGNISIAQLEAVVYAGQAHSTMLPNGSRRGFFIGDGTGVGKGREIAAILWDNWNQGRKKAVWLSQNSPLLADAKRDVAGVGWNEGLIFDLGKIKLQDKIKTREGICFVGYGTLRTKKIKDNQQISRLDQIANWLGEDFDGVIVFDEAHNMGNALTEKTDRGRSKASETALAGIDLQRRLPNARIVYVSATGATRVMNLAYAERLGLWGDKTPFPSAQNFVENISAGGITAMELVAMNLKADGAYMARSLSYDDIKVERLQHTLTPEQRVIYDELAGAWQIVQARVEEAMKATNIVDEDGVTRNGEAKGHIRSAFWGTNQRFWNQVITAMQMPTLIKALEADITAGHAPILQLVNTNEAAQERAIARLEEDETLEDLDITPREMLMEYIKNSFPVHQYQLYTDEEGNVRSELVKDSAGNPVINQDAVAMREELLNRLGSIRVPDGPLEIMLDHFGVDNVAEVTGRTRRVVYKETKNGRERIAEPWSKSKSMADADAFMSDRKKMLIFSQAGGTGRSYHADNTAKNKRLRRHYVVQAGWRAETAVQGLGRSHRTNQAQAPEWILLSTDLEGQKRFISTIARRLNQLGALTKGSRETGSQGLFSARDNLESREAKDAWIQLLHDIHSGEIPDLNMTQFMEETGLDRIIDQKTGSLNKQLPDVTQFLNRILNLKIERQNQLFEELSRRINIKVAQAIEDGTLDAGVETIRAKRARKLNEQVVHEDERTKAKATYLEVELTHDAKLMDYPTSRQFAKFGYARNLKSGRVWALSTEKTRTDKNTGDVRPVYVAVGPGWQYHDIAKDDIADPTKYKFLVDTEAETNWNADYAAQPKEVTENVHMVTGSILPIWDRLPAHRARIYRLNVEGKNIIGRVIDNKDLQATLTKLNATRRAVQYNPAEVFNKILNLGYTYTLANNWKLRRRKVAGEPRVELEGANYYQHMRELEKYGVFMERISYNTRLFIPTEAAAGARAIAEIIETRPIVAETGSQAKAGDINVRDAEILNDLGQFYDEDPDTKLSVESQTEPARVLGEAQLEELTEQLAQIIKGIKVIRKDGKLWIKTKSDDEVRISAVEEITPESVALALQTHYPKHKLELAAGKKIAGMYHRQKITLVKNVAGIWTLSHEFYHFLEDIGAISNADKLTLNRKITALISKDAKTYGYLENRSLPERRAEWVGRTIAGSYDATTNTGKILAKIREIIDIIINALGIRTAQGVIRDIKTGEIYKPLTAAADQVNNILKDVDNATEKPYPYAEGETTDGVSDTRKQDDIGRGTGRMPGIQGFTPTVVGREKAGTIKAPAEKINSARDAAQVAAPYLTKYPDENLISLVLDAKRKLLHVFQHASGLRGESLISISTLAGEALNTPGAKYIIVAHNHPSGNPSFSVQDRKMHERLENLLAGSGVTLMDSIVVTQEHYAAYNESFGHFAGTTPDVPGKVNVPVLRRVFETAEVNEKITSTVEAYNLARRYIPQGGALLLNNQHQMAGTLNITDYSKIRGEAQKEILQALEKHNASVVIIFAPDKIVSPEEAANLKKFFVHATGEIKLLDILDKAGSKMEAGTMPYDIPGEFLSVAETAEDLTAKVTAAAGRKVSRAVEITTGRMSPETKPTLDKLKKHWREFWRPFSTLNDGDKALTARYQAMGNVAKAVRFIDKLKTELETYPPEVKKDMFWYLNGDIPVEYLPDEAREMAQNIKRRTEIIGEMLVDRGILTQETFDKHKGKYVHYMYAKHIVGEDGDIGVMPSGKLDLSYTLARNPNLTTKQRRELGLIEDASVAVPVGMGKALTDIAKFDFLETIANNPEWVWQPSVVRVAIGAKLKEPIHGRTRRYVTMSVGKLIDQVKIYNEMMRTAPSPDVKEIHDTLATALDRAQTKAQKAPEDFVELPNTRHYGPLAGAFVAKPIADDLKPVMDITADQGALFNTMLQIHREGMAYFKMGKVALNVPTATRNIVSNIIQQNMRGRSLPNVIKDIISGIESFKAQDKIYEEAFGMGLFNTNWFTTEINDVLNEFRKAETGRWDKVLTAVKNVAKYYGRIDDIAKLAIFKQMRQSGASIDEAALEAMKWGMDYSLTSRSVKGLRQTIVPFVSYQYKIAPLIAESLIKRPWVLAKFALIYPAAKMLAMALHDLDDDDWEDLEKQLPAYIKNAGSVMILPWKSPAGHWQWVNMEYFFPWGNYLELFRNAKDLDTGGTMRDLGISNPFLGLFYTGLSARDETGQPPTHPFYGTPIYNQLDPAPIKAAKYLEYVVNTWMPAMLTRQGAAGYTGKAIMGKEDRWGKRVTVPQALARWFGVNIVSVSPEQSRAQISVRLQDMHKEMARVEADPSRSEAEKNAYRRRFDKAKADLAEQAPAAILPITKAKGHDPVYDALREMAAQGILKSSPPARTMNINGISIKMSMEQYRDYLDTSSDIARRKLSASVTSPAWAEMPAWRKTELVNKIITTARKQVRQRVKAQMLREHRDKLIEARRAKRQNTLAF